MGVTQGVLSATDWEFALTHYYLRSDGPLGSSALMWLDATALPAAIGKSEENLESVRLAFLEVFKEDAYLEGVLNYASVPPVSISGTPGYFRYLVLTCIVPTIVDGGSNEFQKRLGELLGRDSSFTQVNGIARLWEKLREWCERERLKGEPFRRLELPDPGIQTRIGYSNNIAFPTWRGRQRLEHALKGVPIAQLGTAPGIIDALRPSRVADALGKEISLAYDDFSHRFRSGDRLLRDHRLWRLMEVVAVDHKSLPSEIECGLEIDFGSIRTEMNFTLWRELPNLRREEYTGSFGAVLSKVQTRPKDFRRLLRSIKRGLIAFHEHDWGIWEAVSERLKMDRRTIFAATRSVRLAMFLPNAKWTASDNDWYLSSSISDDAAASALRSIGAIDATPSGLSELELAHGIRIGNAILGRLAVLPYVRAPATSKVAIRALTQGAVPARLECDGDTLLRVVADAPLVGRYEIVAIEGEGGDRPAIESTKQLIFDDRSAVHDLSQAPRPMGYRIETESDGAHAAAPNVLGSAAAGLTQQCSPQLIDLGEAIYARGLSGWSERELISLIVHVAGSKGPRPWDILRMFQEAGWLTSLINERWRARRWYLQPPRLIRTLEQSGQPIYIVDGAISVALMHELKATALGNATELRHHLGASEWTLPIITMRCCEALQAALGWRCEAYNPCALSSSPTCWKFDIRDNKRRERVYEWSWGEGSFVGSSGPKNDNIELSIWRREDDWDLYQIRDMQSPTRPILSFESRVPAIIEAHRLAGRPLFKRVHAGVVRTANDGHLPMTLSELLRNR